MKSESFSMQELRGLSERVSARAAAPLAYSRLMLHEVAPRRVHACWQIMPEELAREPVGGVLVLRLHDTAYMDLSGANPHACIEISVHTPQGHHYAELPGREDTTVLAELGWRLPNRRMAVIAKSELAHLPPASPAPYSRLPPPVMPSVLLQSWFPLPSWRSIEPPEAASKLHPTDSLFQADAQMDNFCNPTHPITEISATFAWSNQIFSSFCLVPYENYPFE